MITYVNPAVAVALGVGVLGEPLTPEIIAAFGLILAGSVLATRPGLPRPPSRPVPGPASAAGPDAPARPRPDARHRPPARTPGPAAARP